MKEVDIWTDGSCKGNPGPGGWGVLLRYKEVEKRLSGAVLETTNNRMEMQAVIEALKALKQPCQVRLHVDSIYVKNGITQWIQTWIANNWRNANKKPVKNKELWVELLECVNRHHVQWIWVKGHSGESGNEIVDQLANEAVKDLMQRNASQKD